MKFIDKSKKKYFRDLQGLDKFPRLADLKIQGTQTLRLDMVHAPDMHLLIETVMGESE